mgnify:CR=1 FL=1
MKQLFIRFKAEMPRFWKIYRNVMAFICTGSTAVWMINTELSLNLPILLIDILKYVIIATVFMGFTAQLTKK